MYSNMTQVCHFTGTLSWLPLPMEILPVPIVNHYNSTMSLSPWVTWKETNPKAMETLITVIYSIITQLFLN